MIGSLSAWFGESLSRKLMLAMGVSLAVVSVGFLILFVGYYRDRLISERAQTVAEVNGLLQGALENAMLKRDLEGLRDVVEHLGAKPSIKGVMILNPLGEVRFSSEAGDVGKRYDLAAGALCPDCASLVPGQPVTAFLSSETTGEILRSVNPVSNKPRCGECHGPAKDNPMNGILVVDYDAVEIRRHSFNMAGALAVSGVVVLLSAFTVIAIVMRRAVLAPVAALKKASEALSSGDLSARVDVTGSDELALLAHNFNDMSQRLESQRNALETRERFLQALIDAIPDGVRVIADDYTVVNVNQAFLDQQGLERSAVVGRPCYASSHGRSEPCIPTMVTCPLHEVAQSGASITCRHVHVTRDNSELQVEVSAAPLEATRDDVGKSRLLIVEAIRDLNRELKHSHEERLSEIGQLAAGVAHEVRNPLSSVHLALQALRRSMNVEGEPDYADNFGLMDQEIDRCIRVTDRLLKLASPPADMPELVEMGVIVPEVLSLLKAEAERDGIIIVLNLPLSLRVISTDSEMRMVVFNLAQNAFHAMPDGGTLMIRGLVTNSDVVLTFADTGVGIDPENQQRIFHPFWSRRADGARGTGLGLPICREILRRYGGNISVTSTRGVGTTFHVTLPWAEASDDSE